MPTKGWRLRPGALLVLGLILVLVLAPPAGASTAKRILAESFTATW